MIGDIQGVIGLAKAAFEASGAVTGTEDSQLVSVPVASRYLHKS